MEEPISSISGQARFSVAIANDLSTTWMLSEDGSLPADVDTMNSFAATTDWRGGKLRKQTKRVLDDILILTGKVE